MIDRHETIDAQAAVAAWRALAVGRPQPTGVRLLGTYKNRPIYRLEGAGPGGTVVIAKHCPAGTASVERLIYERILPQVPVTTPRYYGCVEEDMGSWLFLEDVGSERFSHLDPEQRAVAARWLGQLHVAAADVPAALDLPDRGPRHYLGQLRGARQTILENLGNPALGASDLDVLRSVVTLLDAVEAEWAAVEEFCARMPSTLAHGDFRPKNVYVRHDGPGARLYPIDWEMAGWGVPAADLAPARGLGAEPQIDLASYCDVVEGRWRQLDEPTVGRLAIVGTLFRRLAAIEWSAQSLAYSWPEKPIVDLTVYRPELEEALAAAPWAPTGSSG